MIDAIGLFSAGDLKSENMPSPKPRIYSYPTIVTHHEQPR